MEFILGCIPIFIGFFVGNVVTLMIGDKYFPKTLNVVTKDAQQILRQLEADGKIPAGTTDAYLRELSKELGAAIEAAIK